MYLHVEASDEAGHDGNVELKLQTIENLDRRAIGPILEAVKDWEEPVAIAVLPDHLRPVPTVRIRPTYTVCHLLFRHRAGQRTDVR